MACGNFMGNRDNDCIWIVIIAAIVIFLLCCCCND